MATVQTIPTPTDIKDLIDPLDQTTNKSGFQRAHIIGEDFGTGQELDWFGKLLGPNGINEAFNGVLLPQSARGGAVLEAAVHRSNHVPELNSLFYDADPDTKGTSNRWMNALERSLRRDLQRAGLAIEDLGTPAAAEIAEAYRIKTRNFLDYTKTLFLHQDILDKLGYSGLKSLALNGQDVRFASNADVAAYLQGLADQGLLDFQTVENNGLFKRISELRAAAGGDVSIDELLINEWPDLSRIIYPNGEVRWTPEIEADNKLKSSIYNNFQEPDGKITPSNYEAFTAEAESARSKSLADKIASMIRQLRDAGIETAQKTLAELERAFVRTFHASAAKMAEYAEYAEQRAKYILSLVDEMGAKVPELVRAGLQKAKDYYSNPDGGVHKTRLGLTVAAGVLAIADLWVEADKRGGFFTPEFGTYLKETLKDVATSIVSPAGVLLIGAQFTPLGPVLDITLGAVLAYTAIRKVLDYVVDTYGQDPGFIHDYVKPVRDWIVGFEQKIEGYVELAKKAIGSEVESLLEGVTGRAIEWVGGQSAIPITQGNELNNWLVHRGAGEVYGDAGNDALVGWFGEVIHKGEALDRATREHERAAEEAYKEAVRHGDPTAVKPVPTPDVDRADEDYHLLLDGGAGKDWVIAIGGEEVTTAGGLGRDWIYNTSSGGEIWGDVKGSVNLGGGHYAYFENGQQVDIADGHDNSDNFWYAPDVTIMDAQHSDVLKFYGLPLTGGDANGGLIGLGINGLAGAAIGLANAAQGNLSDWTKGVYFDHLFPWMTYQFQRNADGNLDLYITNQFDQVFRAFFSIPGFTDAPSDGPLHGYMKVANVDVIGSRLGALQFGLEDQGSLGMVFRAVNPLQMLLPILNLVPGAIGAALYYSVYADTLASTAAAIGRAAKAAKWSSGGDPLVIDLDGDGIETISLDASRTYFDVDGDLFRERTGWLKGDDGFLVLDANGNGRVDDISEMFGNRFQGGYDELAAYDSNGDGKITMADAVWASLQVWQDKNRDGVTQDGELKTLDQLGITELSLIRNRLSATTSAGGNLQADSSVTFADGRVSTTFCKEKASNDNGTSHRALVARIVA